MQGMLVTYSYRSRITCCICYRYDRTVKYQLAGVAACVNHVLGTLVANSLGVIGGTECNVSNLRQALAVRKRVADTRRYAGSGATLRTFTKAKRISATCISS